MTRTLTTEQLSQIKADIASRKAMPEFGKSIEGNIERLRVIGATRSHFSTETVEMLVQALEEKSRALADAERERDDWIEHSRKMEHRAIEVEEKLANLEAQPVALVDRRPAASGSICWQNGGKDLPHGTELFTAPPAPAIPDIGSSVVNDAAWKLHDTLTKYGPLNGHQFNNLKGCLYEALKIVMTAPPAPAVVKLPTEFYSDEGIVVRLEEVMAALAVAGVQYERKANAKTRCEFPASEVPEEMTGGIAMSKYKVKKSNYAQWVKGWNACRAAMLAQPVSSGYKLPDGWIACSEQNPIADGAYWCWFGKEKPSVIQQRVCIWNDRNHEWCDSAVTHWMPLPAAPEGGNG